VTAVLSRSMLLDKSKRFVYTYKMRMTINRKTPEAMKDRGITTQRRLLLDVLHQARRHLSARQLYQEAIKKNPRISLATVYRSLRLFKELDLVEERHLNKADCYYEIKRSTEHYHLMCRACGRVVEFESSLVDKLVKKVQRDTDFDVVRAVLHLEGYCSKCREEGGTS